MMKKLGLCALFSLLFLLGFFSYQYYASMKKSEMVQEAKWFITHNRVEINKMMGQLKLNPGISEGIDFPYEMDLITDSGAAGDIFKNQYPGLYKAGFRSVSIYNSCLIISDRKSLSATELLYCRKDIGLREGEYKNSYFVVAALGDGWYLLHYDDYI
jgi:hypothetical protein